MTTFARTADEALRHSKPRPRPPPNGAEPEAAGSGAPHPRRLDHVLIDSLETAHERFDDELVEGVIGRIAMVVLYGDSNTGKTFLAFELSCCIGAGEEFLGRRTAAGIVVYLATEAAASVLLRAKARQRVKGKAQRVVVVTTPVNLFAGEADAKAIIELVADLEKRLGDKVVMIVADTLARISAGANENAGEDMGRVLQRADAVRLATGATFLWVHHCGKDAARGMRGWSGMRAAIDTEIEITADEASGIRTAEVTKQRDLPGKNDRFGFRLDVIELGVNRWGSPRTSCVVVSTDAPPKSKKQKKPSEIEGAIVEFLTARGSGCLRGAMAKHFEGRYVRQSVYRTVTNMLEAGTLIVAGGIVALPGAPVSVSPIVSGETQETPGDTRGELSPMSPPPYRGGDTETPETPETAT